MKITRKEIPQMTIEEFAEKNELEMEIHERPRPVGDPSRYYAHFRRAEVKDGGMLVGSYGDGATPELAIENYAPQISLRRLVIDAYSEQRRELEVPRLVRAVGDSASDREGSEANDPKLSDCGGRRSLCGKAAGAGLRVGAQAVTPGAVRCSAWLAAVCWVSERENIGRKKLLKVAVGESLCIVLASFGISVLLMDAVPMVS
jgi:hypothetical protein